MANIFEFNPPTGLSDENAYPTSPVTESAAREQIQRPMNQLRDYINTIVDLFYPVGSIYISTIASNPGNTFGGVWVAFGIGKTLVGLDISQTEFNTVEKTGGEKTHKLVMSEMPKHQVGYEQVKPEAEPKNIASGTQLGQGTSFSAELGGDLPHNNLQPYVTVYMWKRTS